MVGRRASLVWWTGLAIHISMAGGGFCALTGFFFPRAFWDNSELFVPALLGCGFVAVTGTIIAVAHVLLSNSLSSDERRFWTERLFVLGPLVAAKYLQSRR